MTRIVVTELEPDETNPEPWYVEWSILNNGKPDDFRHRYDCKAAAQQLVGNLLRELTPGLTKKDVLTVNERKVGGG